MRILIISQWCQPEPELKAVPFARELIRLGHSVEVLTGFPNYPGGKVYPGYRIRPWARETREGVPIIRVALYPHHGKSGIKRAANYLSFALSAALVGPLVTRAPDVVYAYHPPPTIALPAWVYRLIYGAPIVYDVQDFWPDTLAATGMIRNRALLDLVAIGSNLVYRSADRLVVLSPGFKRLLAERGIRRDGVEVIYNWCDDTAIAAVDPDPELARRWGLDTGFNLVFAGNMGAAQALDTVLDAAKVLQAEGTSPVRFVFIGGGIELDRLRARAGAEGLTNVVFIPRQSPVDIGKFLALADALLVHLKDDPLFAITIPSKTQAYLAVGKPVLMAVRGDAADLVAEADCGLACLPEDPRALAETVRALAALPPAHLRRLGENARAYYFKNLSLAVGARRFVSIFQSCLR